MKIILSRKGFDSKYGKGFSPILPNGEMLSMPIPAGETEQGVSLKDIMWGDQSYFEIVNNLYPNLDKFPDKFHFDPEIHHGSRSNRAAGWLSAFGQVGAAQSHLVSEEIEVGDIFLFFGSFVQTYREDDILRWEKQHEFHAIFGYLEIGEILDSTAIAKGTKESVYQEHPHFLNRESYGDLNAIYIASKELSGTKFSGAGTFKYRDELRLTMPGYKKSQWSLPSSFHPHEGTTISRCSHPKRYRKSGETIQFEPVSLGQDMVVNDESGRVEEWARELITGMDH